MACTKVNLFLYTGPTIPGNGTERSGVVSIYEDLWAYRRSQGDNVEDQTLTDNNDDAIYDEVETIIPTTLPPGAKIISVEEPASAYDEVIINDGEYHLKVLLFIQAYKNPLKNYWRMMSRIKIIQFEDSV